MATLRLGDIAPNFQQDSSAGLIDSCRNAVRPDLCLMPQPNR